MLQKDFYGDNARWFVAKVIDNLDPLARGRVKISIKGIHSENQADISVGQLPWAHTMLPTTEGGTSGIGKHAQLFPNALVFGIFLDGEESQLPLILGSLHQFEQPADTQNLMDNLIIPPVRNENIPTSTNIDDNSVTGNNEVLTSPNAPGTYGGGIILSQPTIQSGDKSDNRDSRRWASMNFFVENGFSIQQAAGITGNLETESGFNPQVVSEIYDSSGNRTSERSQGIAQWNPAAGRLQQLQNFAKYSRRDWRAFTTQLLFIMHEFKGQSLGNNDGASSVSRGYKVILQCTDFKGGQPLRGKESNTKNATYAFHRWHSGGGNPGRDWIAATLNKREKHAKIAYTQYISSVIGVI